jgi:signal transduction histidine kinase
MSVIKEGQAHVAARARLMLLLGEQLITDEIAAVSELVKNSFDADAENVMVTLYRPSNKETGKIEVWDNGNGMTLETVLSSWLELGTLSKARDADRTPRYSEIKKRIFLGEKGLGRLAVHKLGYVTDLVTRRMNENLEIKLTIDWTLFEKEGFLDEVPVKWEVREPIVFTHDPTDGSKKEKSSSKGTCITITKLRRDWTEPMMKDVQEKVLALKSPFMEFSDFDISFVIDDDKAPLISIPDMSKLVKTGTYTFKGVVDREGKLRYCYRFSRPDLPQLTRDVEKTVDIKTQQMYIDRRKPTCGEFSIKLYSWDAFSEDLKAVFGEQSIYREMIRPNSGVKVFRDGFRVYPYGNYNNDWLRMDARRVEQSFELRLSRNQVIAAVEISSKTNPQLIDKTDREGLIDNQAYQDFVGLVLGAISVCEQERFDDRRKMKKALGRTRAEDYDKLIFTRNLAALSKLVAEQTSIKGEFKLQLNKLIDEARASLESILQEKEQPLLVAASIGISYLIPTHEVKRNIDESLKLVGRIKKSASEDNLIKLQALTDNLREASKAINGLADLSVRSDVEPFPLKRVAESSLAIMNEKLRRSGIVCQIVGPDDLKGLAKENLVSMVLLNFLDNSFYWLQRVRLEERQIKIIVCEYLGKPSIIVSDSGPGFQDPDINIVTLPFFTRKPDGMGLGLYIADRIAKMNGGSLFLLNTQDYEGLLSGASIGISLQNVEKKKRT